MFFYSRKKREKKIRKRLELLSNSDDKRFPCINAQDAVNELSKHLLGEDWYIAEPLRNEQANAEIIYAIESKYKRK